MTRTEKLERIRKYRPRLYEILSNKVPFLVSKPDLATQEDIDIYNNLIDEVARLDHNNMTFKKNFSF